LWAALNGKEFVFVTMPHKGARLRFKNRRLKMTNLINDILNMLQNHWFWGLLTFACLAWYSTITIYVAIKGAGDIRQMLRRLARSKNGGA
jgi:hypothetical protein